MSIKEAIIGSGLLGLLWLAPVGNFCFSEEKAGNIFPAGSFEVNHKKAWSLWGWKTTIFTIDKTIHKEGKASGKIETRDINERGCIYAYCPLKGGRKYKISFWYKVKDFVPDSSKLSLSLAFNLAGGANGSAGEKKIPFTSKGENNSDWQQFTTEIVPPQGTAVCQFAFTADNTMGMFWIDGLTIIEQETENKETLIRKTDVPPVIDGKDNDQCWQKKAPALGEFFLADYKGNQAAKQTKVKLAYDENNLFVFYRCLEPQIQYMAAKVKEKDGPVCNDDCVELFVSPLPGKTYQLIVNSIGAFYDSRIEVNDQTMKGYITDTNWDSGCQVKAFVGPGYWAVEIAFPFQGMNVFPQVNDSWLINFCREEKIKGEDSTFSRLIGSFYQPKCFSKITFANTNAVLVRASKIAFSNALLINRSAPLFKELLTDEPGHYTAYIWDHNLFTNDLPKDIAAKFTAEEWKKEVQEHFDNLARSGIMSESLPWSDNGLYWWRTEERLLEYYKKYGVKVKCCTESSAAPRQAIKNGAEILNKKDVDEKKADPIISWIDPVYVEVVLQEIISYAKKYKDKPYLATIEGCDEPYIYPIYGKISEMGPKMKGWNDEVINKYGFGKYSMPAPNDPCYWQNPEKHPFQKIAFNRWMSDKFADTKKQMYSALKQAAPNVQYMGIQFWFMSGFVPYDYSLFARYTDWISGDPYASSAERREGRGIYNHGFGTKFLKDLGGGKPTITVVQAFHYAGYTPTADDLREWVSQALKNGASRIEYLEEAERYKHSALYQEMFRLSKIFTSMNKVNVPQDADCAIFCSFDSEAALEANGDQTYTAYAILGEKIGSWFDFICDRQLERNEIDLSKYKIIYLPLAKYIIPSVVDKLASYVENGGILVVGDPEAFSFNRDGSSLASYREKLCGAKITGMTFKASEIKMTSKSDGLSKLGNSAFPILKGNSIYDKIHLAHSVSVEGATVIALFPNGWPAVMLNDYGKGKVFYFAANPFAPDVVLIDGKISELFRAIQKDAGVKTDRPIWRFLMPK